MKIGKIKIGAFYKGKFYERGTLEYEYLMEIISRESQNKNTLLDLMTKPNVKPINPN